MIPLPGVLEPEWLLLAALAVDLVFGELPAPLHPVVWTGKLVEHLVRRLPRGGAPALASGLGLAVGVPTLVAGASLLLLETLANWRLVATIAALWLLTSSFSVRLLGREAEGIARMLEGGRLLEARARLSHLCSRDSRELDAEDVAAAVVESVAENTSDSYVAPVFWYCILGVPGAILFRAINTLDAMIGYRGEFEFLGKASARLDDLMCWIPARLTALLFLCVGAVARGNPRRGFSILMRDRHLTTSPNAGFPMASMAGVLGVRLAKRGEYELGRGGGEPGPGEIFASVRVLKLTTAAATSMAVAFLALVG